MTETRLAPASSAPIVSQCSMCRRSVLIGESMATFLEDRTDRTMHACDLCRPRAVARGWEMQGAPEQRRAHGKRMRVEVQPPLELDDDVDVEPEEVEPVAEPLLAPELAVLQRAVGDQIRHDAAPELLDRIRRQDADLARLRRELDPTRRAEEQRILGRQAAELRELRAALAERDARIERLQHARHSETSPMRMSGFALDAFNQSDELERMARIARTLGEPTINVHDEGPGIPRRVRLTLVWEIAWYEFVVKLDLGAGRASVHATGSGGDPTKLPTERRRANANWRDSGIVL